MAVDLENKVITQNPELGVRTKNSKYWITFLLDIPELLKVVKDWDTKIRKVLPGTGFWFAPFKTDTGEIDLRCKRIGENRVAIARINLKVWLDKVGLPYHSPHKFRHGHIHYGLEHSSTVADYKAVSMNVMHSSIDITDETYSKLNEEDIKIQIAQLGQGKKTKREGGEDLYELFQEFMKWRNQRE